MEKNKRQRKTNHAWYYCANLILGHSYSKPISVPLLCFRHKCNDDKVSSQTQPVVSMPNAKSKTVLAHNAIVICCHTLCAFCDLSVIKQIHFYSHGSTDNMGRMISYMDNCIAIAWFIVRWNRKSYILKSVFSYHVFHTWLCIYSEIKAVFTYFSAPLNSVTWDRFLFTEQCFS